VEIIGHHGGAVLEEMVVTLKVGARYYPIKRRRLFSSLLLNYYKTTIDEGYIELGGFGYSLNLGYDIFILDPHLAIEPYISKEFAKYNVNDEISSQNTLTVGAKVMVLLP